MLVSTPWYQKLNQRILFKKRFIKILKEEKTINILIVRELIKTKIINRFKTSIV